jgi:hypothetical protein
MRHYLYVLALIGLISCKKEANKILSLPELEKAELATGIRYDSLFLGLRFGMTTKEFYAVCWDLNKAGLLREGVGNTTAVYQLDKGELKYPAELGFYPKTVDDKISEMPVVFSYKGWAPWNEDLQSKYLIIEVKKLMDKWYDTKMSIMQKADGSKVLASVKGNRRIVANIVDDREVLVTISDLTAL